MKSDTVFSDDFDDGDLEGWDLWGWNWTTPIIYEWDGSIINDDGILTSENPQPGMWSYACQESNLVSGTWSFDWRASTTDFSDFFGFMFESIPDWVNNNGTLTANGYFLQLNPGGRKIIQGIQLQKHVGTSLNVNIDTFHATEEFDGWHNIVVTRNSDGLFKIFFDDELVIEKTDTDISKSTSFCIGIESNSAFDNIRISDTIDEPGEESSLNFPALLLIGIFVLPLIKKKKA
ncbi:MAG: family 16 glycoside hydrolase [Candidatus Kariarchaeaceae archaeon]